MMSSRADSWCVQESSLWLMLHTLHRPITALVATTSPLQVKHIRFLVTFSTHPTEADAISLYGVVASMLRSTSPISSVGVKVKANFDGVRYFPHVCPNQQTVKRQY